MVFPGKARQASTGHRLCTACAHSQDMVQEVCRGRMRFIRFPGMLDRLGFASCGLLRIWIAHVLCADYAHDETLSTLRVANRVSSIVNKPLELRPEPPDPEPSIAFAEATWLRL